MLEFGTDGIRGIANVELSPEIALALGRAVAGELRSSQLIVGCDTRRSGAMLKAAFTAGVMSCGVEILDLGIFPTGGVAFVASQLNVPAAVISASHNPFQDNGIKIFGVGGRKLSDQIEERIESRLREVLNGNRGVGDSKVGRTTNLDFTERYLQYLRSSIPMVRIPTSPLRVAVDCAHGSASAFAGRLLKSLGCEVVAEIGTEPDGENINLLVGSTYLDGLRELVLSTGADVGLAFDGDADRLLAVDNNGLTVDGDGLLALFAREMHGRGALRGNAVVATVMSNLGLESSLRAIGVQLLRTDVGDRNVMERLDRDDFALGGEQSGHIIFPGLATTGDGLLTATLLISLLQSSEASLHELMTGTIQRYPQVLMNVATPRPKDAVKDPVVISAIATAEERLGKSGRVLVRPSGTETVVRVMVEAMDQAEAMTVARKICDVIAEL